MAAHKTVSDQPLVIGNKLMFNGIVTEEEAQAIAQRWCNENNSHIMYSSWENLRGWNELVYTIGVNDTYTIVI